MSLPDRRSLVFVVILVPTAGLLAGGTVWVAGRVRHFCALSRSMSAASRRSEELEERRRQTLTHLAAKQEVAAALVAGRLRLLEAAARVRDLDRASCHFPWEQFRRGNAGQTDEERHCNEVIQCASWMLIKEPDRRRAFTWRLEEELREHLSRGRLTLPGVGRPAPAATSAALRGKDL